MAISLYQTGISNFLAEAFGNLGEVPGETKSNSPGLVLSSLDDQGQDISFVFILGQELGNFLERFNSEHSNLILLVTGPVLEDVDQVGDDVLLLVDLAHVRDLGGRDSLQQQHLFIGNVCEFPALSK